MPITSKPSNARPLLPAAWRAIKADPLLPAAWSKQALAKRLSNFCLLGLFDGARAIGCAGIKGEHLHIAIDPDYQGKWFSPRIARAILDFGFSHSPARLVAVIGAADTRTARLIASGGFIRTARGSRFDTWELAPAARRY